ncbi:MAG: hypothetical protein R3F37_18180 [Candidatus Competibacteraceae bacterium]
MDNRIPSGDVYQSAVDQGWWIIRINGIYIALFFLWTQFHWGGKEYQALIGNLAYMPAHVCWVAMWWRTAMHPALSPRARWGWRVLTAGALCNFIASCITWSYMELVLQQQPFPSSTNSNDIDFDWLTPSTLVLFIVCPLLVYGFTLLTEALKSRVELFKFCLDTGIVLVGLGTPVWYFLVRPIVETHSNASETALLLQYPATTLVLLFAVLVVLLKSSGPRDNSPLQWLALGILVDCAADMIFNYLIQQNAYQTGDPLDTLYLVGSLLLMTGAQWEYVRASGNSSTRPLHERHNPFKSLPYPAVLVAYGLLLAATFDYWRNPLARAARGFDFRRHALDDAVNHSPVHRLRRNLRLGIAQAKHESEAHFAALVRQSSDLIAINNLAGCHPPAVPRSAELVGVSRTSARDAHA